jgi:RNA polymerase sigma factor (sigma-70 family)
MEASSVPRLAPAGVRGAHSPRLLRVYSDERLVALIRAGSSAAFEAVYDRHHRAILSFCRHMLGSPEEAEDAVQHTFLSAYSDLCGSSKPIVLRPWLFTIARNRCYSVLRARRDIPTGELDEPATEGLATQVQRRQELRDLVADLGRLPDEQRAALVLAEMDALNHDQIADVLGVPKDKVKSLVFQARESLIASRAARETDCSTIREQLSTLRGGALRRGNLKRHLSLCEGCRDYRAEIDSQRKALAIVLPVAPTLALKEGILGATVGGAAGAGALGAGTGMFAAGSALKGAGAKGVVAAVLAGIGTAGTYVAVRAIPAVEGELGLQHHLVVRRVAAHRARASHVRHGAASSTAVHAAYYDTTRYSHPITLGAFSRRAEHPVRARKEVVRLQRTEPVRPLVHRAPVVTPVVAPAPQPSPVQAPGTGNTGATATQPSLGSTAFGKGKHGGNGNSQGNGAGDPSGGSGDGSSAKTASGKASGQAPSAGPSSGTGNDQGNGNGGGDRGGSAAGGATGAPSSATPTGQPPAPTTTTGSSSGNAPGNGTGQGGDAGAGRGDGGGPASGQGATTQLASSSASALPSSGDAGTSPRG